MALIKMNLTQPWLQRNSIMLIFHRGKAWSNLLMLIVWNVTLKYQKDNRFIETLNLERIIAIYPTLIFSVYRIHFINEVFLWRQYRCICSTNLPYPSWKITPSALYLRECFCQHDILAEFSCIFTKMLERSFGETWSSHWGNRAWNFVDANF